MKGSSFLAELKHIFSNRKILIPILAVAFVPVLYAGMFLWAFLDPYAHMTDLPVAVVNQDAGSDFEGEHLQLGKDLVDKLEDSETFKFNMVSKEKGYKGLENQDYYILVEIPENFSANATTLLDDQPEKLEIKYVPNEGSNFLSGQIGETAMEKIKAEISKKITATYAETMFDKVTEMADGLDQASDGAGQIHDGAVKLEDGSKALKDNLEVLASKSIEFKDGIQKAATGANDLAAGTDQVKTGLGEIEAKLPALIGGTQKAQAGVEQMKEQLPGKIAEGINEQLQGSVGKLNTGVDEFETQLGNGLSAGLTENIAESLSKQLAAQQMEMISKLPEQVVNQLYPVKPTAELLQKQLKAQLLQNLKPGIEQGVKGGLDQGFTQFKSELNQQLLGATNGIEDQLKAQTAPAFSELATGIGEINKGQLVLQKGINQLYAGSQALNKGASDLTSGMNQLSDGAGQIQEGSGKLADGSKELNEGTVKLADGSTELSDKLTDGAEKANSVHATDDTYDMMGEPVTVEKQEINKVPNYGTGFAPYFISLGLFVGALLISIVFALKEPVVRPKNALGWFFSKFGVIAIIGIIQAILVDFILLVGLNIEVKNIFLFFVTSVITSFVFMTLVQMLVTMMGDPGRFIAIVILILQLTTSAGTFPLELIPDALQPISALLPMTYSVQAFKAVVSSGDFAFMWHNNGILLAYTVAFMLITLGYFKIKMKRQVNIPAAENVA
ncbi:YhgE/Pip domain-containing protein [Ferdinandcohnia quinoae]|uniref:YhgE/Pip domain-containing protein n=1 Tax=Fredinandcohnia quinoae TaxID=2918902 RepID=A0AAW5E6D6_9BACI|nr:YhgE/Pip domain-containing protein [Fredinandcohnia sp. SECRCQ15]MCH1625462.1 YhgE/Pip domain-containing protein [Fredinandcohnia sp. SECRCQ15]